MYQIQNIVFDIEDTERDLARWAWGIAWVFFRTKISESNLPKQIVFQNIENSRIHEYVKI